MSRKREDEPSIVSISCEKVSSSKEENEVSSKEPSAVMKPALAAATEKQVFVSESGSDLESNSKSGSKKVVTKPSVAATKAKDERFETKPSNTPTVAATTEKDSKSDSESESEKVVTLAATTEKDSDSGSQSGSEEGASEYEFVKLARTKRPVNESFVRKRSRSSESDEGGVSSKRVKVMSVERKPYFQRLWTEDDEMLVLQAVKSNGKKSKNGKSTDVESSSLVEALVGFAN
ncbi:PREDICTED: probable transcription factor At1g11510 [Camelina sativa]|uniref:Probable transcription factor At1g11510 n=1 Tax=Camelina sativa TaxID=90675 RepID=A0ABM1RBV8_CAMSA|nr:PREDICTED: probable transcription factor At1g11510 [Camelina sativa]